MILKDLIKSMSEAVESVTQTAVVEQPSQVSMPCELIPQFQPKIWTCRKLNGNTYYVFYQGHFLNVTALKQAISNLYAQQGHLGQGFSKMSEPDLMTYSTTKIILKRIFESAFRVEINVNETAEYLFNCENFNFTRE